MSLKRSAPSKEMSRVLSKSKRSAHNQRRHSMSETKKAALVSQIEDLQAQVGWLEQEREHFSSLFDAMPVAYVLMDEDGIVNEFNKQLEVVLGFRHGILGCGPLVRLVMAADVPLFLEHLRQCKVARTSVATQLRMRNGTHKGL